MDVVVMMGHDYHSEMRNWESQLVLDFTCHEEGSALQIEDEKSHQASDEKLNEDTLWFLWC